MSRASCLAFVLMAGCGVPTGSQPYEIVATDGLSFSPATLTVPVGTTVHWRNSGGTPHTVTSGASSSPSDSPGVLFDHQLFGGEVFDFTPTTVGELPYFCRFHEAMGMKGMLNVVAVPTPY